MAGHVECAVLVRAPVELTWQLANKHAAMPGDDHELLSEDATRRAVTLAVTTPPDPDGRVWSYQVERVQDPERRVVYSRRWGHPHLRYSYAWWSFREVPGGTEIRCVQDFETTPDAPVDDRRMEAIVWRGTEASLRDRAALIEARASRPD